MEDLIFNRSRHRQGFSSSLVMVFPVYSSQVPTQYKLTGPIPPELGNMSKLSYLQLNNNELVGSIPAELGQLELFELCMAKIEWFHSI
ncbi:LRR receptor-like serine/threonine-protein kinase SIK1 [Magnolia sinica]|uniref:LRR receptor-like serine/threonine-protein kinase SIK1 n=1 Tax=Magnolia sinica TaxID=86752 RepID=UPI002659F27B|nr:LRR receptor-like serine/threonine-protein kinase SIK1 [Magnolia sinica]